MWKRYTPKAEHKEEGLLGEGEALVRHYGVPKDALLFFNVHSDANDEHGDINEAILKKILRHRGTAAERLWRRRASAGKIRRRGAILFIGTLFWGWGERFND